MKCLKPINYSEYTLVTHFAGKNTLMKLFPHVMLLAILRKLQNMAPFQLRKQLVESLILSKLDYCDLVYYALPSKLLKRLQHVQSSAACFITGKFSREEDLLKLGWLPMMERRDWHLLIATFKALNDQCWPKYASLKRYNPGRSGAGCSKGG